MDISKFLSILMEFIVKIDSPKKIAKLLLGPDIAWPRAKYGQGIRIVSNSIPERTSPRVIGELRDIISNTEMSHRLSE